jgi:hypothetical protein
MPPVIQKYIGPIPPTGREISPIPGNWANMGYHGFLWSSMVMTMEFKRFQLVFPPVKEKDSWNIIRT